MEETFFKRVSVKERLPETANNYFVIYDFDGKLSLQTRYLDGNKPPSELLYWLEPLPILSRDKMIEDITEIIHEKTGLNKDNVNVELCESIADAILNSGLPEKKVEIKDMGQIAEYKCPSCNYNDLIRPDNFCPSCGSKILWIS